MVLGRLSNAVDLNQLIRTLMNVKSVELVRLVADRPLFDGAELDAYVSAIHVERLAANEERIAIV